MSFRNLQMIVFAGILLSAPLSCMAENGALSYSGGSFSVGTKIVVTAAPLSVAGATLSFTCPVTASSSGAYLLTWTCSGGSVTITSADKSLLLAGTFVSGSMSFSGGGGGKGGHVSYSYVLNAQFSGEMIAGGAIQGANGSISQYVNTTSQIGAGGAAVTSGSFGWSSAYAPVLVGDNGNGRIVAADNITGANLASFGMTGTGIGEFTTIAGITEDASGRIYVADSGANRLVRFDDLSGKNWVELGSAGTGANHFSSPIGVKVDAAGKIWVADAGNDRIVRMDDMNGTNWTSFGTAGTGVNQFSAPSAIAFDAQKRIYVADTGNGRLVRFDDLTGNNWVTLSEVLIDPYGYPFGQIDGVAVNAAGQIYVSTGGAYGYLIRCDDMTGLNPRVSEWAGGPTSMSLDKTGTIYVASGLKPGLAQMVDATGTGYFASALGGAVTSPGPVYARPVAIPPPAAAVLSAQALTFGSQNVGEPGAAQTVKVTNLGADPLTIDSITASADFNLAKTCGNALRGGASCAVSVSFDPVLTGARAAELVVTSNGVHPSLVVALSGTGTAPTADLLPGVLTFDARQTLTASAVQIATLVNSGTGPLTIASIKATGDFAETNNCGGRLAPGSGCTIGVSFKPTAVGARLGSLTIADDAVPGGTTQAVALTGTGVAAAPPLTVSPEGIQYPEQEAGTVSASQTVTLRNASGLAVTLGAPVYPAGFKVTSTCGTTLAKGASCVFQVAFAPAAVGRESGKIAIPVTGQAALTVGLSGRGTAAGAAPVLAANPAAVNFGQVVYNDDQTIKFTVMNTSGLAAALASHRLSGDPAITLTSYNCPAILASGASCTVGLLFTSTSTTPVNDSATFTFVEGTGAVTQVPISGQAVSDGGGGN